MKNTHIITGSFLMAADHDACRTAALGGRAMAKLPLGDHQVVQMRDVSQTKHKEYVQLRSTNGLTHGLTNGSLVDK